MKHVYMPNVMETPRPREKLGRLWTTRNEGNGKGKSRLGHSCLAFMDVEAKLSLRNVSFVNDRLPGQTARSNISHRLHSQGLKDGNVVVDGSSEHMTPLPELLSLPGQQGTVSPRILRLQNDDLLRIKPSPDPKKGTALYYDDDSPIPVFVVVPKDVARERLQVHKPSFHKKLRIACCKLFGSERFVPRGNGRWVIFDNKEGPVDDGYLCAGPKVRRSAPGVSTYSKHATSLPFEHDLCQTLAARMEHLTREFIPTDDLHTIEHAQNVAQWPRFRAIRDKSKQCKLYAGFNLSSGTYHNAHLDDDFGYTTALLFDPVNEGQDDDTIVRYFCFPRLGVAIGLRVGDVIIFNAREWHCSSSMSVERQILSFGGYVKTGHVGGNDNRSPLTAFQSEINESMKSKQQKS